MSYTSLEVNCPETFVEIMMAELAELGFSTFQENENGAGFSAYAEPHEAIDESAIRALFTRYQDAGKMDFTLGKVEKENWNADWEKNYDPIAVEDKVLVRANFHPSNGNFPIEIIVTPKMSFGTGHHETTYQMLALMYDMDFSGKYVLDAGCGTGILAIMAYKKNAQKLDAYDIDEWAVENSIENFELNGLNKDICSVWQGEVQSVSTDKKYDVVLANINKNILMADIPGFSKVMPVGGKLLLSGFYEEDVADIEALSAKNGFIKRRQSIKNNWVALSMEKIE